MAKKFRQVRNLNDMLKSPEIVGRLEEIGGRVLAAASTDSNPAYVESLDLHTFESKDRATVQVGAAPAIGLAVEAKRGTLARALGAAGG